MESISRFRIGDVFILKKRPLLHKEGFWTSLGWIGVARLVATDDGEDASSRDVKIDNVPLTKDGVGGRGVIVTYKFVNNNQACASWLVRRIIGLVSKRCILTGIFEEISMVFRCLLIDFVIFP